jgi:hypothetical protein
MMKEMTAYFAGEKQESLLFVAVGLLAIAVAAWLWMNGHRLKSMAFPLVAIAVLQLVVGGSVYLRTDQQLATLGAQQALQPAVFKQEEVKRMNIVMKNFSIYKAVEMVLLVVGIGLIAFYQRFDVVAGVGVGLVLQAAFTLTLDIFAEARGRDYLSALASQLG